MALHIGLTAALVGGVSAAAFNTFGNLPKQPDNVIQPIPEQTAAPLSPSCAELEEFKKTSPQNAPETLHLYLERQCEAGL